MVSEVRRRPHAFALAGIVLVSLVFRLYVSHACSLWFDEDFTHAEILRSWPAVLAGPDHEHPLLLFVLVKLVTIPFGDSATALRAVSLLSGCVLLVAVNWLCLELGLAAKRALGVVALLAITPFFMRHAIEARMYALFPALATLSAACLFRLLREPKRLGYLTGFAFAAGAMAATHYFGLAYAFALLGALLVGLLPRRRELELTLARGVGAALTLAALFAVLASVLGHALTLAAFYSKQEAGRGTWPWPRLLRSFLTEFSFIGTEPWAARAELLLSVAGLGVLARSLRGVARVVPLALAFCPCIGALFLTSGHFVAPRYLAPSWVFYHVGACVGLFALVDGIRGLLARTAPKFPACLAWTAVLLPVGVRLSEYPASWGAGEEDYRGLQSYFMDHLAANTALVTFPGRAGTRMMGRDYPVNRRPIELEHFKRVAGIKRYLVAEIHLTDGARRAELERLVRRNFGLAPAVWRGLPLLELPGTTFQRPVRARLLSPGDGLGPE